MLHIIDIGALPISIHFGVLIFGIWVVVGLSPTSRRIVTLKRREGPEGD